MKKPTEFHSLDDLSQGIERRLADGLVTHIYPGEHAMLSIVDIQPNAAGPIHSHPQEQWGVMLSGSGVRTQGGEKILVKGGDFWRTPPKVEHGFMAGSDGARILDFFSPPRNEYENGGAGVGFEK